MYRINIGDGSSAGLSASTSIHTGHSSNSQEAAGNLAAVIKNQLDMINPRVGGIGQMSRTDEILMTTVKVEPMQDAGPTTSNAANNGHVIFAPKRARLEGYGKHHIPSHYY